MSRYRLHVKASTASPNVSRPFSPSHSYLSLSVCCHLQCQWWGCPCLSHTSIHSCSTATQREIVKNSHQAQCFSGIALWRLHTQRILMLIPCGRYGLCLIVTCLERYTPATLRTTLTPCFCVSSWPSHSLCSGSSLQHTQHY